MKFSLYCVLLLSAISITAGCKESKEVASHEDKLPETSKVLADGLKVRLSPNTMGSIVGTLDSETQVKVLNRSAEKFKLGSQEYYWYRVRTDGGLSGWVYGAYLDIERDGDKVLEQNKKAKEDKLREMMTGRWYATKPTGALTPYFIMIDSRGYFEFGRNRKAYQHGKYELVFDGNRVTVNPLELKKPMYEEITGELFGQTFTLKAIHRKRELNFMLTDKSADPFRESEKKKVAEEKAKAAGNNAESDQP